MEMTATAKAHGPPVFNKTGMSASIPSMPPSPDRYVNAGKARSHEPAFRRVAVALEAFCAH